MVASRENLDAVEKRKILYTCWELNNDSSVFRACGRDITLINSSVKFTTKQKKKKERMNESTNRSAEL
jgi:hypothetical protein